MWPIEILYFSWPGPHSNVQGPGYNLECQEHRFLKGRSHVLASHSADAWGEDFSEIK